MLDHGEAEDKEDDVSGPHRASDRFIIFPIYQAFFPSSWRNYFRLSHFEIFRAGLSFINRNPSAAAFGKVFNTGQLILSEE